LCNIEPKFNNTYFECVRRMYSITSVLVIKKDTRKLLEVINVFVIMIVVMVLLGFECSLHHQIYTLKYRDFCNVILPPTMIIERSFNV
jgi:hypothetical protein